MFSMLDFQKHDTLGAVIGRMRCKTCGQQPNRVEMWSSQGQTFQPEPAKNWVA